VADRDTPIGFGDQAGPFHTAEVFADGLVVDFEFAGDVQDGEVGVGIEEFQDLDAAVVGKALDDFF